MRNPREEDREVIPLLTQANTLLKAIAKVQLGPVLERELSDKKRQMLYAMTGKSIPIAQISRKVGMSTGSISGSWKRWEFVGLLSKEGGQYKKVIE
jgi:hypothetical protein